MEFNDFDYDLKDEIQKYRQCEEDYLYKFLLYKSSADNFDCDRGSYAKEVYQELWGFDSTSNFDFQNICVGSKEILMGMDTMNSFWTTFAWCLNTWCKDDIHMIFGISKITLKSVDILLHNYGDLKRMLVKNTSEEIFCKLQTFAKLTHTIGNLVLVPKYIKPYTQGTQTFNQARALQCNDYFDLSLKWILKNDEDVWDTNTLDHYFDIFILRDYVTLNNQIIPFTDTHKNIIYNDANNESRPKNMEELIQLLDNINNKIINRGKKMHQLLMNKNIDINQDQENTQIKTNLFKAQKPLINANDESGFKNRKELIQLFDNINNKISNILKMTNQFFENKNINQDQENRQTKINLFRGQEKLFFVKSVIGFSIAYCFIGLLLADFLMNFTIIGHVYIEIIIILTFLITIVVPIVLAVFSANKRRIRYIESHNKGNNNIIKIFNRTWSETLRLTLLPILLGFIVIPLLLGVILRDQSAFMEYFSISLCSMISFLCPPLVWGFLRRCRYCKMYFMLKKTETEEASRDNISVKVNVNRKDTQGNVVGTQEQWIPGTRIWYRKYFICSACGQVHYSVFFKDYKNI